MLNPDWLRRDVLEQHQVDMRQFIDFRQATLVNGQRVVEAYNSSGLAYTILPDRGLDLWSASFNGIPLTWISQGSPFVADMSQTWLRQFNGGLLTTCGLTHAGPPEKQPFTDGGRGLHGLYSRLQAGDIAVRGAWGGERYVMELTGTVCEAALFREQLRLERTYHLTLGEPVIAWSDRVTNAGDQPAPLMVLYHINVGYPLVRAGAQLHTPHQAVYPRDDPARAGIETWALYEAGTPRYAEQVFFHHLKANSAGRTQVALLQETFGLLFEWDTAALPYLTQWKNTRQGIYVCGVEPGNCLPEGQVAAREKGRLVLLEPGETQSFGCTLTALSGKEAIELCRVRIDALSKSGAPVAGCKLDDYAG